MNREEKSMYVVCSILLLISLIGIFSLQSNNLITGNVILEETEIINEFQYIEPENPTRENALTALMGAEDDLTEMINSNINVLFIQDSLLKAKRSYIGKNPDLLISEIENEGSESVKSYLQSLLIVYEATPEYEMEELNYSQVFRLTQLIEFRKQQAFTIIDTIPLIEEKEKEYKKNKINTSEGLAFLEEAKTSFYEERYDEAEAYLKEAELKLDRASSEQKRINEVINLSKNFFQKYWLYILSILVILGAITPFVIKTIRKKLAKNKLEKLKSELETLNKLMKKAQEDCFKTKKITQDTYKIRMERYKSKIVEIKHTIPKLEFIAYGKVTLKKEPENKKGILEIKR